MKIIGNAPCQFVYYCIHLIFCGGLFFVYLQVDVHSQNKKTMKIIRVVWEQDCHRAIGHHENKNHKSFVNHLCLFSQNKVPTIYT